MNFRISVSSQIEDYPSKVRSVHIQSEFKQLNKQATLRLMNVLGTSSKIWVWDSVARSNDLVVISGVTAELRKFK